MSMLRVAVVGCGGISLAYHLPILSRLKGVRLAAVVDTDEGWARHVAHRFSAPFWSSDSKDLIGRVEAALVATPNATHAAISSGLLAHGIHVLCEKPLAISVSEATAILRAAERGGGRVMAAQSRRFGSNIRLLHRMVTSGLFGQITSLSASLGGDYRNWDSRTDFRSRKDLAGGGVLLDTGIHLIDLAIWLLGTSQMDVLGCRLDGVRRRDVEDDAELELNSGSERHVKIACSYVHELDAMLRIDAELGWARAGLDNPGTLEFCIPRSRLCRGDGAQRAFFPAGGEHGYVWMLSHFCDAVRTGQPFAVSLDETIAGLRVVETCYAQATDTVKGLVA